jgi:hypothetical protein
MLPLGSAETRQDDDHLFGCPPRDHITRVILGTRQVLFSSGVPLIESAESAAASAE